MVEITVKLDDHNLSNALRLKGSKIDSAINKFTIELTDIAQKWVRSESPVKTGKLKSSVSKSVSGNKGVVWLSKSVAPYFTYVIEGTRPHIIRARYKKALRVPGYGIFKSVKHPGTKANPFVDKASVKMQGDFKKAENIFAKWLAEV